MVLLELDMGYSGLMELDWLMERVEVDGKVVVDVNKGDKHWKFVEEEIVQMGMVVVVVDDDVVVVVEVVVQ